MRATEEEADLIHQLVTKMLIKGLSEVEPNPAILDKALKFLKDNGITAFVPDEKQTTGDTPLSSLSLLSSKPNLPSHDDEDEAGTG